MAAWALALGDNAGRGWQHERDLHHPHLPPSPALGEAFAGTLELIHPGLSWKVEVELQFPAAQLLVPFKSLSLESSRGSPPSLFPTPKSKPENLLAVLWSVTPGGHGKWSPGLPHSDTPTLAQAPFLFLCPLLKMPGACFVLEKEASCERLTALGLL